MKQYEVTFTKPSKYSPTTRTVRVETNSEQNAATLVHREFGGMKFNKKMGMELPTKKITIDDIKVVDKLAMEV